ncbi:MAG: TolC family outer membrane protein [Gammaproteobacteria bacterium]|nr:TolC family outer membrane protein [Gammaproteobacteria bacterium]
MTRLEVAYVVLAVLAAGAFGGISPEGHAQEAAPLSLSTAVQWADAGAPSTRANRYAIDAAGRAIEQAQAELYPRISVDGSLGYSKFETTGQQLNPQTLAFEQTTRELEQTSTSYGLNVTQPLYDRRAWKGVERAKSETELARTQLELTRQELMLRVAETYFTVLRERGNLALAQSELEALGVRVHQLEGRHKRGLSSRIDLLDAQVRKEEVEAQVQRARNALEAAVIELERLVGASVRVLQAADVERVDAGELPSAETLNQWVQEAMERSPAVDVAAGRLAVQRDAIEVQRSGHYPTVSLQARHSDTDRTDQVVSGKQTRVFLQLEVPLYAGGGVKASVDEAQARANAAQARLDDARRQAFVEVRRIANELRTATRSIMVLQRSLDTAEARAEATERALASGLRDQVQFLEARARVFEIRRELTNAVYDRLIAQVRIDSLTGRLDPPRLEALEQTYLTDTVVLGPVAETAPVAPRTP